MSAAQTLYAQVQQRLKSRIAAGEWRNGEALPSETALAQDIGVSQGTVRKALNGLVSERIVVRRQGKGTFVNAPGSNHAKDLFYRIAGRDGALLTPELRSFALVEDVADEDCSDALAVRQFDPIWQIERLFCLQNRPAIAEVSRIAKRDVAFLEQSRLDDDLYKILQREAGLVVVSAEDRLLAVELPDTIAWAFGADAGTPGLFVNRIARDVSGRPVEWRKAYMVGEAFGYSVSLR